MNKEVHAEGLIMFSKPSISMPLLGTGKNGNFFMPIKASFMTHAIPPRLCSTSINILGDVAACKLSRPRDDVMDCFSSEIQVPRLDRFYGYLWLAEFPSPARPLYRQKLMNREDVLTQSPKETSRVARIAHIHIR